MPSSLAILRREFHDRIFDSPHVRVVEQRRRYGEERCRLRSSLWVRKHRLSGQESMEERRVLRCVASTGLQEASPDERRCRVLREHVGSLGEFHASRW